MLACPHGTLLSSHWDPRYVSEGPRACLFELAVSAQSTMARRHSTPTAYCTDIDPHGRCRRTYKSIPCNKGRCRGVNHYRSNNYEIRSRVDHSRTI
jgi:hypothetical protein